jgi:hypothetical protein
MISSLLQDMYLWVRFDVPRACVSSHFTSMKRLELSDQQKMLQYDGKVK